tara:strand:- start:294 stop:581 length:288 start_codon:yes stop_codon:yes gene_type:complete
MDNVSRVTFWAVVGIVGAAMGGLFAMSSSHAVEDSHGGAAKKEEVVDIKVKVERIGAGVENNKEMLTELKGDFRGMRETQSVANREILEAIRNNP